MQRWSSIVFTNVCCNCSACTTDVEIMQVLNVHTDKCSISICALFQRKGVRGGEGEGGRLPCQQSLLYSTVMRSARRQRNLKLVC